MKTGANVMSRLVWFVLKDGRSIVAGCVGATREALERVLQSAGAELMFTRDDGVETIPASNVRGFVLYDARTAVPSATSIYRLLHY
jgi:hypothetical protein